MESVRHHREPLSGMALARDTTAVLYAGYVSAEVGPAYRSPRKPAPAALNRDRGVPETTSDRNRDKVQVAYWL
ncbi:MAG TPA: hypothetical protein VG267_07340 [Terracidiphilus sp.]|nr:hypothetical protein [Terracidiphilus sp.]